MLVGHPVAKSMHVESSSFPDPAPSVGNAASNIDQAADVPPGNKKKKKNMGPKSRRCFEAIWPWQSSVIDMASPLPEAAEKEDSSSRTFDWIRRLLDSRVVSTGP